MYKINVDFNERTILNEDSNDILDTDYGNNNVSGNIHRYSHATKVAGIIKEDFIKLMPLAIASQGDTHDKDIALAIRYAVDNGANIINMSFGKFYSLHKEWVFEALKYAENRNVLIVSSAGNKSYNLNEINNYYPNDNINNGEEIADNFLLVGVSSAFPNENLFASYSNYFKPSRTIAPNDEIFDPEKGYQAEVGVKWEKPNVISATFSGFYMLKNNIVERNTVDEFNQIGEADSKGVELDVEYTPIKGLYAKAGYAFVEAKVRSFDTDALQATRAGNKLQFAPDHLANAWVSYEFQNKNLKNFGVGTGFNYTGENYTDSANTFKLPDYYTWDATLFYKLKNVRIALNINNITDQFYYTDAIFGNQFFPGLERNYKISLGYNF